MVLSSKKRQVDHGKLFDNSNSGLISLHHGGSCTDDVPLCYDQCMQLGLKHDVLKFFCQLLYFLHVTPFNPPPYSKTLKMQLLCIKQHFECKSINKSYFLGLRMASVHTD